MKEEIKQIIKQGVGSLAVPIEVTVVENPQFGHYATNLAMRLAKERGKNPFDLAKELAASIAEKAPGGFFQKVEAAPPGFINFWLSKKTIAEKFAHAACEDSFGRSWELAGQTVMVEFTDPNPFKLFHIGHLMSNTIGESFARLHEWAGANVIRANYEGDVGVHVAKAIWGMMRNGVPAEHAPLAEKVELLGAAYAAGAKAYESDPASKSDIDAINKKIYSREDARVNELYDAGKKWSLEYFETVYARLGTKFNHYFFESEVGGTGVDIVRAHSDIFKASDGATIFPGEAYGLHTRVFISSQGLPTYEAKELGLNKTKFDLYPLDTSVIVTGNEIVDYFKVLLKVIELVLPDVAKRTRHVAHGMLRLPSGKMSSRTGDVITADALLTQLKERLRGQASESSDLSPAEREAATEVLAIGAIKYSILKQNPGQDIVFDFEKSLSTHGDSGPYIQYAYARLRSIVRKAGSEPDAQFNALLLEGPEENDLVRKILEFPDIVAFARESLSSSGVASYLYKLSSLANKFYETTPILKDENEKRRNARLMLVCAAARTIKEGLKLLGIQALEKL